MVLILQLELQIPMNNLLQIPSLLTIIIVSASTIFTAEIKRDTQIKALYSGVVDKFKNKKDSFGSN